ncbi:hypothetical protein BH11GEM1_BH11GEM1_02220 [soil metagenome]
MLRKAVRGRSARWGFSLPELLVALVLFALVGGAIVKTLSTGQRAYDAPVQHVDMQQNMRLASSILTSELRELDASDGDIQAMDSVSVRMRSMRQTGIVCTVPVLGGAMVSQVLSAVTFAVRDTLQSIRYFAPADSVMMLYEGNNAIRTDDSWLVGSVFAGTDPGTGALTNCTDVAGRQGRLFKVNLYFDNTTTPAQLNAAGNVPVGALIRAFQSVTFKRVKVGNDWFVGFDSAGVAATSQPIVGPLADSLGLKFSFFDSLDTQLAAPYTAAVRNRVARISIALALRTASQIRRNTGSPAYDVTRTTLEVALRNNRRF